MVRLRVSTKVYRNGKLVCMVRDTNADTLRRLADELDNPKIKPQDPRD